MLPPIVEPGNTKGSFGAWVTEKTGMQKTQIIAAVSHDSAAAVAAIPDFGKKICTSAWEPASVWALRERTAC